MKDGLQRVDKGKRLARHYCSIQTEDADVRQRQWNGKKGGLDSMGFLNFPGF